MARAYAAPPDTTTRPKGPTRCGPAWPRSPSPPCSSSRRPLAPPWPTQAPGPDSGSSSGHGGGSGQGGGSEGHDDSRPGSGEAGSGHDDGGSGSGGPGSRDDDDGSGSGGGRSGADDSAGDRSARRFPSPNPGARRPSNVASLAGPRGGHARRCRRHRPALAQLGHRALAGLHHGASPARSTTCVGIAGGPRDHPCQDGCRGKDSGSLRDPLPERALVGARGGRWAGARAHPTPGPHGGADLSSPG
jgi:hypothetical protein